MNKQRQKTDSSTGSLVAIFTWFCPTKLYLSHVECHIFYHDFSLQKNGAHVKVIPGLDVSYLNKNKFGMRPPFFVEQILDVWGLHCAISKSSIPKLQKRNVGRNQIRGTITQTLSNSTLTEILNLTRQPTTRLLLQQRPYVTSKVLLRLQHEFYNLTTSMQFTNPSLLYDT